MAAPTEHTHRIKIRSTQMEIPSSGAASRGPEDYDRKLKEAHEEMERIQQQQEQLERKKQELEELTARKRAFVSQQVELSEKLTSALTLIDRELFQMRSETEDLEQCRTVFAGHLEKIQKFAPENWTGENLSEKLDRSTILIDLAIDEYDQAANHFEGTRCGAIFGRASKRGRNSSRNRGTSEFMTQFYNGLAFNLPIITLGSIALVIYFIK